MRLSEAWTKRLVVSVLAILLASVAWYFLLWAISPKAPVGDNVVRIWARYGRAFYVNRANATVLGVFVAFWGLIFGWGLLLLAQKRVRRLSGR